MSFRVARTSEQDVMAPGLRRQPIIARIWTGRTRTELADEYLEYNYQHGVLEIEKKPGCLGAQAFRRTDGDVTEFTTISYWRSMDAMRAMHGDGHDGDVRRVAHLARDPEYLLELPEFVEIRELYANDWTPAARS